MPATTLLDPHAPRPHPVAPSLAAAQRRSAELEAAIRADPGRFRVLTGDRPTGPLHVGHLFGTLLNRVRLQDLGVDVMVLVADYQTITDRDAPDTLPADVLGLVADYLAAGLDPDRCTIFAHSQLAALNQLLLPFLSLVSVAEVSRNPTVKDEFGGRRLVDVRADVHLPGAPGGRHPVLPRQPGAGGQGPAAARRAAPGPSRAGSTSGTPRASRTSRCPDALLTDAPLLLGVDGRKMSKSRHNAIALAASEDETARLIRGARTDAERTDQLPAASPAAGGGQPGADRRAVPGTSRRPRSPRRVGDGGAAALKRLVTEALNERLRPIRARRREFAADPGYLRQVLADGNARARAIADRTLSDVQSLMHTKLLNAGPAPVRTGAAGSAGRSPRPSRRDGG